MPSSVNSHVDSALRGPDYFVWVLWFVRLAVPVLMLTALLYLDKVNYRTYLEQVRADVFQEMGVVRAELEGNLNANLQTVRGLVAALVTEPDMGQERFAELAQVVLEDRPQLRNVGAAPDLVIRMVYPLEGNRSALGLDYRTRVEQFAAVKKAAEEGHLVISGPVNLVQGGQAFIGRVPVLLAERDGSPGRLWGLVSAVIDIDRLYQESGLLDHPKLDLALKNDDIEEEAGRVFFGAPNLFDAQAVTLPVALPGATWQLAGMPVQGWPARAANAKWLRLLLALTFVAVVVPVLWLTWSLQRQRIVQTRLRALFELSPLGIALNDIETGAFVEINDALVAPSGYTRAEFLELNYWQLTPTEYRKDEEEQLLSLKRTGRYGPYEKEYLRKSGERYPVLLNGMLVRDASGRRLIWSIIEDISERKRIERMKNDFVSTVSHELRTPLTSISGALGLLHGGATGELPETMSEVVAIAHRNSQHLTFLINDLLDMDKLMFGNMTFDIQWRTLAPILEDSLKANRGYAEQYDVNLELRTGDEDVQVYVDDLRLQQIMSNLLSNAIKFSPEGGSVLVTTDVRGDRVRVSVTDSGAGVPEHFQNQIFQKFSQADSSDTRAQGGTGLGLAISRELIEKMNGKIDFHSEAGRGACFYFDLPCSCGAAAPQMKR